MTLGQSSLIVRVADKKAEAHDIVSLSLVSADGGELPPFSGGAHIDVQLENGLIRQYSLMNALGNRSEYRIAVLREPTSRGGSAWLHDRVQIGQELTISVPRNQFELHGRGTPAILMAGGIGITPMISMAEELFAEGTDFRLHYACRSKDRAAFAEQLLGAPFAENVQLYFDDEPDRGVLDLEAIFRRTCADAHVYVCGPAGFIAAVQSAAQRAALTPERVHQEHFQPVAPVAGSEDRPFTVELAKSGRLYRIEVGQSIVDVLMEDGLEVPVSCEIGVCGTCVTEVLAGIPDHRDSCIPDHVKSQNNKMAICCSRSNTEIITLNL